jgi:hypothetical protein
VAHPLLSQTRTTKPSGVDKNVEKRLTNPWTGVSFRPLLKGGMREKAEVQQSLEAIRSAFSSLCEKFLRVIPLDAMPVAARGSENQIR